MRPSLRTAPSIRICSTTDRRRAEPRSNLGGPSQGLRDTTEHGFGGTVPDLRKVVTAASRSIVPGRAGTARSRAVVAAPAEGTSNGVECWCGTRARAVRPISAWAIERYRARRSVRRGRRSRSPVDDSHTTLIDVRDHFQELAAQSDGRRPGLCGRPGAATSASLSIWYTHCVHAVRAEYVVRVVRALQVMHPDRDGGSRSAVASSVDMPPRRLVLSSTRIVDHRRGVGVRLRSRSTSAQGAGIQ